MTHVSTSDLAAELAETFQLEPIEATVFLDELITDEFDDEDLG